MSYLSAAHAIGALSATETVGEFAGGFAGGAEFIEQCVSDVSTLEKHNLPRQVLIGITLAEISRQKMAASRLHLPQRLCGRNSRQALLLDRNDVLFDFLTSLRDSHALKILAEPVFCAQSGTPAQAKFDGGEFPSLSPIHNDLGEHTAFEIGFQGYGADLELTPRVLPNRTIHLTLCVRQTLPNPTSGTRIGEVVLPALSARAVMADAEIPSGKTLLLLTPPESGGSSHDSDLLVLATAKLVRQGQAATHLPRVF